MAKRLHDTEIWKKKWFRELSPSEKCFWFYLKDHCDCAGILDYDMVLAEFMIGSKLPNIEEFSNHLHKINDDKYFLIDFVEFQYGLPLNDKSPVHKKVINILKRYKIPDTLYDTLSHRVLDTGKEKEKDKDMEKDMDKYKDTFNRARILFGGTKRGNDTEFENFKKKHSDWKNVLPLLEPAINAQIGWRKNYTGFVPEWKNFQTWINQRCWEDENYTPKSEPKPLSSRYLN